ncbi:3'-5' exonuclease [Pleurotus ostreatus]|nr:3'-5' exonuclease [Pleurotus ostreatus]
MVEGNVSYSYKERQPSKYLALDCEMVGVGPRGKRSSVARVSVINYHGAVQLDEFVRQKERVVDYRTKHSGVRQRDLVNAKSFDEIQSRVASLLKDRVLLGHAVFNDLKALSLEHPPAQTLDTQSYAWKFKVAKVECIALRHLVKQELGLTIQDGEHSSVTDARATMAIFRLHEREWEKAISSAAAPNTNTNKKKRKLGSEEQHDPQSPVELARGGGGLNANKTQDKNKNKKGKKGKKNIKNKKPDAQPRLACAWGRPEPGPPLGLGSVWTWDPEPGPPLGLGSVWAWDPEPDVWAGWDEPPQSRSGLGWGGGGGVLSEDRGCAWDGDDDIEHWGRDASKGWSW